MGISEELISEIVEGLADLYIARRIPFAKGEKFIQFTQQPMPTKYWNYNENVISILREFGFIDLGSKYTVYSKNANWYFIALTTSGFQ
ncbi:MAG: hypothetical protein ACP5IZ_12060, partial [Thermoprotei archaeon]